MTEEQRTDEVEQAVEQAVEESVEEPAVEAGEGAGPELETVTRERDEYLDALQRTAAEFDNYRKRVQRDQASLVARAAQRLVAELLPVLDDLERALEAAEHHEEAKLEDGVRLVHRAFAEALRREGLEEIETTGAFDPHVHEALLARPDEAASGTVLEVLQKGYRLGELVLRPARVIVAE
ncbi:MAG TPA: nucleotide exchange factor GrpE [Gaiellaceae bacterium]|nr:nucleotide exchange factor GrpE [Gaiellaceae bacterium]